MGEATLGTWAVSSQLREGKSVDGLIRFLGQSARTGRVLSGGLKFENSWEQGSQKPLQAKG